MRRQSRAVLLAVTFLLYPTISLGRPYVMSDGELDEITAKGVDPAVSLSVTANPSENGVDFAFNMGSTVGNGSVGITPVVSNPSTVVLSGSALPNAVFNVQNMVFNLNICVACNATKIIQSGTGIPITVNIQP